MGNFYESIPAKLIPWIRTQKIFWVASAPIAEDGHVNVSPKGHEVSLRIVLDAEENGEDTTLEYGDEVPHAQRKLKSRAVWYEDVTGSGVETISHVRENGRITVLFTAFEGPPQTVRLFGTGKVYEFGTPEYEALLPMDKRQPGSRAVIWIDVHKVGTSCGFSIPFFAYQGPRNKLANYTCDIEQLEYDQRHPSEVPPSDKKSSADIPVKDGDVEIPQHGLKDYWKTTNAKSIDGLPGILSAYASDICLGNWRVRGQRYRAPDNEEAFGKSGGESAGTGLLGEAGRLAAAFGVGVFVTTMATKMFVGLPQYMS